MLEPILILFLQFIAFKSSIESFLKENKNRTILEYSFLITSMTNLLLSVYLILKIFNSENHSLFSVLVPNMVVMSIFYWVILAKHVKMKDNLSYNCLFLHLFSAVFVINYFIKNKIILEYTPNIYWFIFVYVILGVNKLITGRWSYNNLTNFNKIHSHFLFFSYSFLVLLIIRISNSL